jgi:hypothetical protein
VFFLLVYDRSTAKVISLDPLDMNDIQSAFDMRLELESEALTSDLNFEVVILEAASKEELRQSHARYFENLRGILESAGSASQIEK